MDGRPIHFDSPHGAEASTIIGGSRLSLRSPPRAAVRCADGRTGDGGAAGRAACPHPPRARAGTGRDRARGGAGARATGGQGRVPEGEARRARRGRGTGTAGAMTPEYEQQAKAAEHELADMEERADRLGDRIEEARDDWEAKKRDSGVPGAGGDPERAEEGGRHPETAYPGKGPDDEMSEADPTDND